MKYTKHCGKRKRDCAAWRTNAVNLVVASINKIGFWDPIVSASGWNARVLRVKKLEPVMSLTNFITFALNLTICTNHATRTIFLKIRNH
jgi:hypothetical protein